MQEHQLAADYSWWFLLFAFIGSVVLAGQRALQLVIRGRFLARFESLNSVLVSLVGAVLVVDGLYLVNLTGQLALSALLRIAIVGLTILLSWIVIRLADASQLAECRFRPIYSLIVLIVSMSVAGWSGHRYFTTVMPVMLTDPPMAQLPGHHVESQRYVGMTDHGRVIPLYRWQAESDKDRQVIRSMMSLLTGPLPSVIQREAPDQRSNCHGWVFTRGRFLLTGEHVAQILEDNGYQIVSTPQPGDVVIYRNVDNQIVHTGLVAGILADKSVIVESKWSVGSRFLHAPESQPYSSNFAYYRTGRAHHSVAIRFQDKSQIADRVRTNAAKKTTQRPTTVTRQTAQSAEG